MERREILEPDSGAPAGWSQARSQVVFVTGQFQSQREQRDAVTNEACKSKGKRATERRSEHRGAYPACRAGTLDDGRNEGGALRNDLKRLVAFAVSIVAHSAFAGAILFCFASRHAPLLGAIPITVVTSEAELLPGPGSGPGSSGGKLTLPLFQEEGSQTPVEAQNHASGSQTPHRRVNNPSGISADNKVQPAREQPNFGLGQAQYLRRAENRAPSSGDGKIHLVEDGGGKAAEPTITRRTDWQASPVEDDKLTYSAPDSSVKLTTREVSVFTGFGSSLAGPAFSRGFGTNFAGPAFSPVLGTNGGENSRPFGLTPAMWDDDATARSKRLDGTLVNLNNFGVTAFAYENEVGRDFQPFGSAKNEFAIAGTSTMKAGGQVRVGPLGFGYAASSIDYASPLTSPLQQAMTTRQRCSRRH